MRIMLVRHGSTAPNEAGLILGRADPPLSEAGREQARGLALALSQTPLGAVYTSPLQRCRETAETIAAPRGLSVAVEQGLVELDAGETDGLTGEQLRERHGELLERWAEAPGEVIMPGGESLSQVQVRAWATVEGLLARHASDETVVAVSHNFTILTILCRALRMDLDFFRRLRLDLGSRSALEFSASRATLTMLNDACHLSDGQPG